MGIQGLWDVVVKHSTCWICVRQTKSPASVLHWLYDFLADRRLLIQIWVPDKTCYLTGFGY